MKATCLWKCTAASLLAWFTAFLSAAIAQENVRPWREYRTIMWVGESASKQPAKRNLFLQRLQEMGINAAMVYGDGDPRYWTEANFPYYVENIVNRGLCLKFNSSVTDWNKFVTDWAKAGRPKEKLVRDYSLDDPAWRAWARTQMQRVAKRNAPYRPVAYDIRDELSTTVSANPFDYDFSPVTLKAFREWLQKQYADLSALNEQWETTFADWSEVMPFTTDEIKNRMATGQALPGSKPDWRQVAATRFEWPAARKRLTAWNFSPWADFRTYMDLSLARTLDDLRQASRELDPGTPVGIEGTQMPHAFGGYDLWRISQALDWVEPYDIGNAREIFGSFMPGKTLLTTVFETETDKARRRLWHLLLEGDRACIIWWSEDCFDWSSEDLRLTPKAKALAPVLKEMTSPLATLFLRAQRVRDPVYLHYSQASIQAAWLLESTVDGSTWLRRFSSFEAGHNHHAKVRNSWLKLLQDRGYSPRFVSTEQIESGFLDGLSNAVFVLPASWAISDMEAAALLQFARKGGTLLWDGKPGVFDGRAKLRAHSPMEQISPESFAQTPCATVVADGTVRLRKRDIAEYSVQRLAGTANEWSSWAQEYLPLNPRVAIDPAQAVRIHRFSAGTVELVAFERNISYEMSEDLAQAGGNEPLEKPASVEARLPKVRYVYDLREERFVGKTDALRFTLSPWTPSLYAISDEELPEDGLVTHLLQIF